MFRKTMENWHGRQDNESLIRQHSNSTGEDLAIGRSLATLKVDDKFVSGDHV